MSKVQVSKNVNELSQLNARNNILKNILTKIQEKNKVLREAVSNLKEENIKLKISRKSSIESNEKRRKYNSDLINNKLRLFRNIYNIHHVFPKLQVPLRLRIVQDKFFEATQTGVIESQHYSLDISSKKLSAPQKNNTVGFSTLKGMNTTHAKIICEVLTRIAELVIYLAEVQFVNLPIKMTKSEGSYWLSFHNDPSK